MYHWTDDGIRGYLLLTLLTRKVQLEFKKMSIWNIVEYFSEIELAIIRYKGIKKIIKKIVDISTEAAELSKFLELEGYI